MFDPDEARRLADDLEGRASGSPDPSEFTMRIAKTLRSAIEADDARDHYRRLAERNWESIKEHVADRDRLTAELQAVKDERDGLHRTLKAVVDFAIDECGMPTRYMLGSDAPVRVMRKLKQDRDSYANSDFERQLDEARAETTRLMSIIGLSMSPGTAESLARLERMRTGLVSLLERWEADDNTETVKAILSEASDIAFHVSETIAEPFREAVDNEAKERP